MLDPVPGRTATELARDAGRALPDLAAELLRAAEAFNDVTYGERPGTEPAYRMIADLDDHLRHHTAARPQAVAAPADRAGLGAKCDDANKIRPSARPLCSGGAAHGGCCSRSSSSSRWRR